MFRHTAARKTQRQCAQYSGAVPLMPHAYSYDGNVVRVIIIIIISTKERNLVCRDHSKHIHAGVHDTHAHTHAHTQATTHTSILSRYKA